MKGIDFPSGWGCEYPKVSWWQTQDCTPGKSSKPYTPSHTLSHENIFFFHPSRDCELCLYSRCCFSCSLIQALLFDIILVVPWAAVQIICINTSGFS